MFCSLRPDVYSRFRLAVAIVASAAMVFAVSIPLLAQGTQKPAKKNGPVRFGNILISDYDSLGGQFGTKIEATGPNTTVDVFDAKDASSKTQLKAHHFVALMSTQPDPKDKTKQGPQQVDRVDATGNLRYTSTRKNKEGVTQKVHGTATKGTYFNLEARVELTGPIDFEAQLTDKAGAMLQTAKGITDSAIYDEDKQILKMKGVETISVMTPSLKEPAVLTGASDLTLELAETPPKFHIDGGTLKATPAEQPAKPPVKKKP
ncbi:MAG: hypothetical protein ABJA67_10320 [Chthonomonadales bacterium]